MTALNEVMDVLKTNAKGSYVAVNRSVWIARFGYHFLNESLKKIPGIELAVKAYEKTQAEVEKAYEELDSQFKRELISQIGKRLPRLQTLPAPKSNEFTLPAPSHIQIGQMKKLEGHYQLGTKSCAASGMEAVLKLHGLIPDNDFRFQEEFGDKQIGFSELDRLNAFGLVDARAEWFGLEDALTTIQGETEQGRFPLVSLCANTKEESINWHIYVAARHGDQLVLVNPAPKTGNKICVRSFTEVREKFQETLDADQDRQGINIATYLTQR